MFSMADVEPLKSPADLSRIPSKIDVSVSLKHVMDAVRKIKTELRGKVPLIGFSAAPWTLMYTNLRLQINTEKLCTDSRSDRYYMVGGSSKSGQQNGVNWLRNHPTESKKLLDILTTVQ